MSQSQRVSLSLLGVTALPPVGAFRPLVLTTSAGTLEARLYEASGAKSAILWLGDDRGGFDSPADGLYDRLAERFQAFGVISLRLQYRNPLEPSQFGLDALLGAFLLQEQGVEQVVVVSHGVGALGAVECGRSFPFVVGVALLAPSPLALDRVAGLAPTPLLLMHGTDDTVIPTAVSRALLAQAGEPKHITYYQGAGHDLSEVAPVLSEELSDWLKQTLRLSAQ